MKDYEIRSAFTSYLLFQIFSSSHRSSLLIYELLFAGHIFPKFCAKCSQVITCSFSKAKKISSRVAGKVVESWKDLSSFVFCVPISLPVLRTLYQTV